MILPQQMAIREILDFGGIAIVTKETELQQTLANLSNKPAMVITDSQVFKIVDSIVPKEIPLTSFSILMARYKGFLDTAIQGAKTMSNPMKELAADLEEKKVNYGRNPITQWCLLNTSIEVDKNENIRPIKGKQWFIHR